MQIKLLKDFIKEYQNTFEQSFKDDFEGKLQSIKTRFKEPFLHLDEALIKELDFIISSLEKPVQIGVVGQFSSGKSSLLNLILQKDILPTGAVPVTSKPTFLQYGLNYALKVSYENGLERLCDISELELFTDQRKELKEVQKLVLYAPVPLLKDINLVDMPGLNANTKDEKSTLSEFSKLHSLIWLSLIDNAGKKSEEEAIKAHLNLIKNKQSLCVLNQKDKLDTAELERVMHYANEVFGKYFDAILALSCKEAKDKKSYENSNFKTFLEHLQGLDTLKLKQDFIKEKLNALCELCFKQYDFFEGILTRLEGIFKDYESFLKEQEHAIKQKISLLSSEILQELKAMSEKIATRIHALIKEEEVSFFVPSKSFLHKGLFEKNSYKNAFLSSDDIFLALFYHNESLNKEFKKMKAQIFKDYELLKTELARLFSCLEQKIILFKSEFSHIQRDEPLQSEFEYSKLRAFIGMSDELFLKSFKQGLEKEFLKLDLFFEKLSIKALTNYQSATKLSLAFFSQKISQSRHFFELDSKQFSLYSPNLSEIYERILTELEVHEFENLLIDKPFIERTFRDLGLIFQGYIEEKYNIIQTYKKELLRQRTWLMDTQELIFKL